MATLGTKQSERGRDGSKHGASSSQVESVGKGPGRLRPERDPIEEFLRVTDIRQTPQDFARQAREEAAERKRSNGNKEGSGSSSTG